MNDRYDNIPVSVRAVILAGGCTFGRCPLNEHLPRCLWPVIDKPALQHLIENLTEQGIRKFTICSNGDTELLKNSIDTSQNIELTFLKEHMPLGTAGSIRNATSETIEEMLIVFHASIISPPNLQKLIKSHSGNNCEMTILIDKNIDAADSTEATVEAYICQRSIIDHIPEKGYYDIKENLIPELISSGKLINATPLDRPTGHFRNWHEYLDVISNYLSSAGSESISLPLADEKRSMNIWQAETANVHPSARIYGPAVILPNAEISQETIIVGPAVIGKNVNIDADTLIENSIIGSNTHIAAKCEIHNSLIDSDMKIKQNSVIEHQLVVINGKAVFKPQRLANIANADNEHSRIGRTMPILLTQTASKLKDSVSALGAGHLTRAIATAFVFIALFWSYLPEIGDIRAMWQRSDVYSTGQIVPLLAIYIAWTRRKALAKCQRQTCLWGIVIFLAAQLFRYAGLIGMSSALQRFSIIPSIAGLILLMFGWTFLKKISTILFFLTLMLPWPHSIHSSVTIPLQNIATSSATFCLETMGYDIIRQGNLITINNSAIAVAEACNGLRMASAFLIISSLIAMITQRSWGEKILIVLSSIPISIFCNTIRLTVITVFFTIADADKIENIFHSFGGLAMMPLAIAIVIAELWFFKIIHNQPEKAVPNIQL